MTDNAGSPGDMQMATMVTAIEGPHLRTAASYRKELKASASGTGVSVWSRPFRPL